MLMMDLSAYSPAILQAVSGLLAGAAAEGLDLVGLRQLLARRLEAATVAVEQPRRGPAPSSPRLCPSCGRGPLAPVANRDGLRILGCRLCRYSEVV